MKIRYVLFLFSALLLGAAYAQLDVSDAPVTGCVGYSDSFDVRVLDALLRPIPGASVVVFYDRGATFGDQYYTTPIKLSDGDGMVHFDIANQGTLTRDIDCGIWINASIGGGINTTYTVANLHGTPLDVYLGEVYPAAFFVKDQLGSPLEDATVYLRNKSYKTDKNGRIETYLNSGVYSYVASYQDGIQSGSMEVVDDTLFEVLLRHYDISLDVTDDFNTPLNISLVILNKTFNLPNGHFTNNRTFGQEIPYIISYQGIEKRGSIIPETAPAVHETLDIHAPQFGEIAPDNTTGKPRLNIKVADPGKFASGIDATSLKVAFRKEPATADTPWNPAVTFATGSDSFNAELPQLPPNSIIDFRMEIKDRAGNRAEISGKFSTLEVKPQQNITQNQSGTQPNPVESQGIPLIYIIGGVILVILAGYLVFRLKSGLGGGS